MGDVDHWQWGAQFMATIRVGENSNDYSLGNIYALSGWLTRKWNRWISTSARVDARSWGNIDGADPDLNPLVVPTADPDRRAGTQVDLLGMAVGFLTCRFESNSQMGLKGAGPFLHSRIPSLGKGSTHPSFYSNLRT